MDQLSKEAERLHTLVQDKQKELNEVTQQVLCNWNATSQHLSCFHSLSSVHSYIHVCG